MRRVCDQQRRGAVARRAGARGRGVRARAGRGEVHVCGGRAEPAQRDHPHQGALRPHARAGALPAAALALLGAARLLHAPVLQTYGATALSVIEHKVVPAAALALLGAAFSFARPCGKNICCHSFKALLSKIIMQMVQVRAHVRACKLGHEGCHGMRSKRAASNAICNTMVCEGLIARFMYASEETIACRSRMQSGMACER